MRFSRGRWLPRWLGLAVVLLVAVVLSLTPSTVSLGKEFAVVGTIDCGRRSGERCQPGDTIVLITSDVSGVRQRIVIDITWIANQLPGLDQDDLIGFEVQDGRADGILQAIGVMEHWGQNGRFNDGVNRSEQPKYDEDDDDVVATPTVTLTPTSTSAPTSTRTPTPTNTTLATPIATVTRTATPTFTPTATSTLTPTATATRTPSADLRVQKTGPNQVFTLSLVTYTITVTNDGPGTAVNVVLTDTVPTSSTFMDMAEPAGWTCNEPSPGSTGTVTCTKPSMANGESATFTFQVFTDPGVPFGTPFNNTASASSDTFDPNTGNNASTASATFGGE